MGDAVGLGVGCGSCLGRVEAEFRPLLRGRRSTPKVLPAALACKAKPLRQRWPRGGRDLEEGEPAISSVDQEPVGCHTVSIWAATKVKTRSPPNPR